MAYQLVNRLNIGINQNKCAGYASNLKKPYQDACTFYNSKGQKIKEGIFRFSYEFKGVLIGLVINVLKKKTMKLGMKVINLIPII